MTQIDFLLIIPELFQLVLLNIFLLYALFFSSLGQSYQKVGRPKAWSGWPLGSNSTLSRLSSAHFIRKAYLPTPLQIAEPLCNLMVITLGFSTALFLNNPTGYDTSVILTNTYICDTYAAFFKVFLCLSSAAALALAIPAFKDSRYGSRIPNYEFLLVIYLAIFGMLCLISSYNLLTFYLSIELQSLCFYLLASSRARSEFSAEAGLKYFILGAFSSSILLFGISLVYGSCGSIYFDDLSALLEYGGSSSLTHIGLTVGLACIIISLLFKLAAVPFHMWAPDVYEGSPFPVAAFFAISAKIAALAALARFVIMTEQLLVPALTIISLATLIVGTLSAMRQVKIKRLIAFSGVSNVGWFLMGLCCGRLDAVILHLIVYVILSVTLFCIIIVPVHRLGGGDSSFGNRTLKHISDLSQIYKTNSVAAFALTLAFFSLGGIPLLAGFYSKYLIIYGAIMAETFPLLTVGLISAVLSAFYYIRVVKTVYFLEAPNNWFSFEVPSLINAYLISFTSFFTAFFMAYPEGVSTWLIHISL